MKNTKQTFRGSYLTEDKTFVPFSRVIIYTENNGWVPTFYCKYDEKNHKHITMNGNVYDDSKIEPFDGNDSNCITAFDRFLADKESEQKTLNNELEPVVKNEHKFYSLADKLPDFTLKVDSEGKILSTENPLIIVFGVDKDQLKNNIFGQWGGYGYWSQSPMLYNKDTDKYYYVSSDSAQLDIQIYKEDFDKIWWAEL